MSLQSSREPVFNAPGATLLLVAAILLIHGFRELFLTDDWRLVLTWGFTPLRLLAQFDAESAQQAVRDLTSAAAQSREGSSAHLRSILGQYALELADDSAQSYATLLTHAALHGGWGHVIVNSVWLVAFGSAVNRRFGATRFLLLGALSAMAGALAQMAADPDSVLPMIGASGAVSGYTGAVARFAFAPGAPLGPWRAASDQAYYFPAAPITAFFRDQRAMMFVGVWFVLNFLSGVATMPHGGADAPIAWVAHMGGFLAGFFCFGLMDPAGTRAPPGSPDHFSDHGELR